MRSFFSYTSFFSALLLSLILPERIFSQSSFTFTGNASSSGGDCYVLTPDLAWQQGTAWCNVPIDLSQPQTIQYNLFFGSKDTTGADGIAFVLQNQGVGLTGAFGQGLGYQGITPSVIVEFDTFQNGFDPGNDHVGLTLNGEPDHTAVANAGNPVTPFPFNIEDGNWHSVRITWDPTSLTMKLYFDCQLTLTYTNDILNNVFSGSPVVWWGFTSATGGAANLHQFCYAPPFTLSLNSSNAKCAAQCDGTAAVAGVSGSTGPYSYLWNNGQTTLSATGLCAGTHTVAVTSAAGCISVDSVVISQPTVLSAGILNFVNSCAGGNNGSATANGTGGTGTYTYSWNTSPVQANATANNLAAGNYAVTVTDANGCSATQTVVISSVSVTATAGPNSTVCAGQSVALSATGGGTYSWSNGSTTASVNVSPAATTTYSVTVSVGVCSASAFATVVVNPNPVAGISGNVTVTAGNSTTLTASGGDTYSWSSGQNDPVIVVSPVSTATYCVTVETNGCSSESCITVYVEPIDCSTVGELYLPNAFSPNEDGENDRLGVYLGNLQCIEKIHLRIYDRLGLLVFETQDPLATWDGTFKGNPLSTAVFVYFMKAELKTGKKISSKGNIGLFK